MQIWYFFSEERERRERENSLAVSVRSNSTGTASLNNILRGEQVSFPIRRYMASERSLRGKKSWDSHGD
jgi:hypothetical protein